MTKPNVKDLKCFGQVAAVIGEARAKLELFKVVNSWSELWLSPEEFGNLYWWEKTPQGVDFWLDIKEGVNPYDK